jgi:ElaB/YqjD/DUF883 family membrane-anchored ribosome-binding protein
MPTLMAEAKERLAEPMAELKTHVNQVVETTGRKARVVMHQGRELAEDVKHGAERGVRKHPLETVGIAFGTGLITGALAFWLLRRK